MTTDPEQIRQDVDALLAELPNLDTDGVGVPGAADDAVIDLFGRKLEEAHQVLVRALESVEKG